MWTESTQFISEPIKLNGNGFDSITERVNKEIVIGNYIEVWNFKPQLEITCCYRSSQEL